LLSDNVKLVKQSCLFGQSPNVFDTIMLFSCSKNCTIFGSFKYHLELLLLRKMTKIYDALMNNSSTDPTVIIINEIRSKLK
jgi:hypothetical protein